MDVFKNYYAILEIDRFASLEQIKNAYRSQSKKWHPDKNPNLDMTEKMQDINEAYAILKDSVKKARYDYEYDNYYSKSTCQANTDSDYIVHDENLKEDIRNARQYAEDLVSEFFRELSETGKVAARGAWEEAKGYVYFAIVMTIIGLIVLAFM